MGLQNERNVKWILIVSIIMVGVTLYSGLVFSAPYFTQRPWTIIDHIAWWIYRINALFFIATITTATLATTGFGKKDMMYRVALYLFTISMILLFIGIVQWMFRF